MHHAWCLPEVQDLIFESLDPGDLARLARTCDCLFDIATDHLWARLTSVRPFVCCLPPQFVSRPLRIDEVTRLDFYGRKVKAIVLEEEDIDNVIRLPPPFRPNKIQFPVPHQLSKREKYELKQKGKYQGRPWREVWTQIANLRPNTTFLPNLARLRISNIVEELLLPLIGISGSHLTYVYIKHIQDSKSKQLVREFLDQIQDPSKLECLFVRDGEPGLVPSRLLEQAPLRHLRLDPRIYAGRHQDLQFKQYPLRREILKLSKLEHLTLGLTRQWYGPDVYNLGHKYLPALKTLWLNLRTFRAEVCKPGCINKYPESWTCCSESIYQRDVGWMSHYPDPTGSKKFDCGRRQPTDFLAGLDSPELSLLNIKFPFDISGERFLGIVSAAASSCRLSNLTELNLDGGGYFENCDECGARPTPLVTVQNMKDAIMQLLPLPRLKVLRVTIGPNFLTPLDLDCWTLIAEGVPALQALSLGHSTFSTYTQLSGSVVHERLPLQHIAMFCRMFSNLVDVDVGCVDGLVLEENPDPELACSGVQKLTIRRWISEDENRRHVGISHDRMMRNLRTYFPNSDLARSGPDPRLYVFGWN